MAICSYRTICNVAYSSLPWRSIRPSCYRSVFPRPRLQRSFPYNCPANWRCFHTLSCLCACCFERVVATHCKNDLSFVEWQIVEWQKTDEFTQKAIFCQRHFDNPQLKRKRVVKSLLMASEANVQIRPVKLSKKVCQIVNIQVKLTITVCQIDNNSLSNWQ
jgi:hypothetical protein